MSHHPVIWEQVNNIIVLIFLGGSAGSISFFYVGDSGDWRGNFADAEDGISPSFRIG